MNDVDFVNFFCYLILVVEGFLGVGVEVLLRFVFEYLFDLLGFGWIFFWYLFV